MKEDIANNLVSLHGRIADACEQYDRDADDISVVAVSKRHSAAAIQTAVAAGMVDIGESRIQEAETKIRQLGPIARYHLVGHLQTNKVRQAVELFDVIHSLDSLRLAQEINRRAGEIDHSVESLIQVNVSGEESKHGVSPEETLQLVSQVGELPHLNLIGLMTIGPLTDDENQIRTVFRQCRELFKRGRDLVGDQFDTLSMGMSSDFPLAIAEGSTMIRVGSSIFGPRPV